MFSGYWNYDLKRKKTTTAKSFLLYFPGLKNQVEDSEPLPKDKIISSQFGVLEQCPSGPIHEMRTIRRPARSHNWSTFIHMKGWESLKLLTVQCFYSSHLPHTYCFQISPNWITESTPNDLSCPSTIYHILFYMNFIIKGKYSLTPFSIF